MYRICYCSRSNLDVVLRKSNLIRTVSSAVNLYNIHKLKEDDGETNNKVQDLLDKFGNNILYSGYVEERRINLGYTKSKILVSKLKKQHDKYIKKHLTAEPFPITLKLLNEEIIDYKSNKPIEPVAESNSEVTDKIIQFPFVKKQDIVSTSSLKNENLSNEHKFEYYGAATISNEIKSRLELLNKPVGKYSHWMRDYETYEDPADEIEIESESVNYGTPNPEVPVSRAPCSGCGALLHCKDTAIPGYIPSEIFLNAQKSRTLQAVICQRCHFLKEYNLALQVNVTPSDYIKVLQTITTKRKALVILMVDLLDFPCSIWPGIADLLGRGRPVLVVGNKVDLLPQDGKGFMVRVTHALEKAVHEAGFGMKDILDIGLISAKTGFGIEDLITRLFQLWPNRGDVYLVGCTNCGKSSLYNALMQSDFCKAQAVPLMQRATTSPWPGTTLQLLKFPITRPDFQKMAARWRRLQEVAKLGRQEQELRRDQLRKSKNLRFGSLLGHVGRTFKSTEGHTDDNRTFSLGANKVEKMGLDESHPDFALGKWCYDTPGVVHPDQITDLLTTDELLLTQPKHILRPRTFTLRPQHALFVGGLARLDYVSGPPSSVRFTVFASENIPVTICTLDSAEAVYKQALLAGAMVVPGGDEERLKVWRGLKVGREMTVTGVDKEVSCADIVLSSVGWIAVTPAFPGDQCKLIGWTPDGRGVHLRDESLLPKTVSLRGRRIRGSVAYTNNKVFIENK